MSRQAATANHIPIATGQIKMHGASARWVTILPMVQKGRARPTDYAALSRGRGKDSFSVPGKVRAIVPHPIVTEIKQAIERDAPKYVRQREPIGYDPLTFVFEEPSFELHDGISRCGNDAPHVCRRRDKGASCFLFHNFVLVGIAKDGVGRKPIPATTHRLNLPAMRFQHSRENLFRPRVAVRVSAVKQTGVGYGVASLLNRPPGSNAPSDNIER
jgi:hypothetical protein